MAPRAMTGIDTIATTRRNRVVATTPEGYRGCGRGTGGLAGRGAPGRSITGPVHTAGRSGDAAHDAELVDDELGARVLRRTPARALVAHDAAALEQLAAPDAPRLLPLHRPAEARRRQLA